MVPGHIPIIRLRIPGDQETAVRRTHNGISLVIPATSQTLLPDNGRSHLLTPDKRWKKGEDNAKG